MIQDMCVSVSNIGAASLLVLALLCGPTAMPSAAEEPPATTATESPAMGDGSDSRSTTKRKAGTAWTAAEKEAGKAVDHAADAADKAWDATKQTSGKAWEATKGGAAKAGDATQRAADGAWTATKDGARKAVDFTAEKAGRAWSFIRDAAKSGWNKSKDAVDGTTE